MKTFLWNIILVLCLLLFEVYCQKCDEPKNPKGGKVRMRARGRIAKFRCYRRFTLYGNKILICSGGKWNNDPPICIRSGCDKITPANGMIVTEDVGGAVVKVSCEAPLNLVGHKELTCNGKDWSDSIPACEYVDPVNFCNFENENICGWQHDPTAKNKWIWNRGTTPTRRTGPTYDHTLGKDGNGHYMYMESSNPAKEGENSRLMSPFYGSVSAGKCFRIWYHMYGQTGEAQVGRLTIYIEDAGNLKTRMFSVAGNQGDAWLELHFAIGQRDKPFRFIIEGTKMMSHLGDISIDDVQIYNCSKKISITTSKPTTSKETTDDDYDYDDETTEVGKTTQTPIETTEEESFPIEVSTFNVIATTKSKLETKKTTTAQTTKKVTEKPTTASSTTAVTTSTTTATTSTTTVTTPTASVTTPTETTSKTTVPTTTEEKVTTVKITKMQPTTPIIKITTEKPTTKSPKKTTMSKITTKSTITTIPSTTKTTTPFQPITKAETTMKVVGKTTPGIFVKTTTEHIGTIVGSVGTNAPLIETTINPRTKFDMTTRISINRTTEYMETGTNSTFIQGTNPRNPETTGSTLKPIKQVELTTVNTTDNNSETDVSGKKIDTSGLSDVSPLKPLMIGVGVGVAIGLIIVIGAIYIYMKKRRKEEIYEDEMEPIAKNAVYD